MHVFEGAKSSAERVVNRRRKIRDRKQTKKENNYWIESMGKIVKINIKYKFSNKFKISFNYCTDCFAKTTVSFSSFELWLKNLN